MKRAIVMSAVLSVAIPALALACEGEGHAKKAVKKVSVDQVAQMVKSSDGAILDANGAETRTKMGIIPGAKLLTSASEYAVSELPTEKSTQLVFYCANTKCSASHMAAKRALEAGYSNVAVLPEGIAGWKSAGQKTVIPQS